MICTFQLETSKGIKLDLTEANFGFVDLNFFFSFYQPIESDLLKFKNPSETFQKKDKDPSFQKYKWTHIVAMYSASNCRHFSDSSLLKATKSCEVGHRVEGTKPVHAPLLSPQLCQSDSHWQGWGGTMCQIQQDS